MSSPYPEQQFNGWSREQGQPRKRQVLTGAQTLTTAQSGALCLWNSATGYTFTLPVVTADDIGVNFDFLVTVTNTATGIKVITDAATTYIKGEVHTFVDATTPAAGPGPKGFSFNGTSHIAFLAGGADTTTGGVCGTRIRLEAISTTIWAITGNVVAAGTIATPASTT